MKKKAISLLLVAAMTATMTAGCGDKQEAADNTTAGNDAAPSTEAAASEADNNGFFTANERYIDCMEPTGRSGYRLVTERM